jgi:cold shock CspA family protein
MVAQVTTFIENRGFGFLTDSSGEQYFFHVTNFLREGAEGKERKPKLGEMVSFELADPIRLGGKMQAVKLRPSSASYVVAEAGVDPIAVVSQIGASKVGV